MIIERPLFGKVHLERLEVGLPPISIARATHVTIRRGGRRLGFGIKTDVGLMTVRFHNDEDPLDDGTFQPGQVIRALADTAPIFTGRVVDVGGSYPLNKSTGVSRAFTTITVADAVGIHTTTPRYGVLVGDPFYETFEARIDRLTASALAPVEAPIEGAPREVYAL